MVAKKTEYQNQFRSSVVRKYHDTYLENLTARHARRDREFVHTPICWGELSEDEDKTTSDSTEDDKKFKKPLAARENLQDVGPKYQSVAEIMADSRDKADAFRIQKSSEKNNTPADIPGFEKLSLDINGDKKSGVKLSKTAEENLNKHEKDIGDKSISINDLVDEEDDKLSGKLAKTYKLSKDNVASGITDESGKETDEKVYIMVNDDSNVRKRRFVKKKNRGSKQAQKRPDEECKSSSSLRGSQRKVQMSYSSDNNCKQDSPVPQLHLKTRVRRPDRQAAIPSAKSNRTESVLSNASDKPPFYSYGVGDIEANLALHRTHNVRASSHVYCAALKAKIRREEERKKYRQRKEVAKSRAVSLEKLSPVSPRDEMDLRSEYQKQFHAYDRKEYERALSARAHIPRSNFNPIKAVHRGGCLVVHVD